MKNKICSISLYIISSLLLIVAVNVFIVFIKNGIELSELYLVLMSFIFLTGAFEGFNNAKAFWKKEK